MGAKAKAKRLSKNNDTNTKQERKAMLHTQGNYQNYSLTQGPESDAPTPPTTPRATPSDQQAVRRQAAKVSPVNDDWIERQID